MTVIVREHLRKNESFSEGLARALARVTGPYPRRLDAALKASRILGHEMRGHQDARGARLSCSGCGATMAVAFRCPSWTTGTSGEALRAMCSKGLSSPEE